MGFDLGLMVMRRLAGPSPLSMHLDMMSCSAGLTGAVVMHCLAGGHGEGSRRAKRAHSNHDRSCCGDDAVLCHGSKSPFSLTMLVGAPQVGEWPDRNIESSSLVGNRGVSGVPAFVTVHCMGLRP